MRGRKAGHVRAILADLDASRCDSPFAVEHKLLVLLCH